MAWIVLTPLIAACATNGRGGAHVLARTDDFLIARAERGATLESLAATFLGNPAASAVIQDANAISSVVAGQILTIPLKPSNPAGVFVDGYQVVPVLCYHQFGDGGKSSHRLEVSAQKFEIQMAYLADNGYRIIRPADLADFLAGTKPIPKRSVVITIDDGFQSAYSVAYPILKKYNFPTTIYLYTDFIGGSAALTWPQIQSMQESGIIDFQSHSKTHPSLSPGRDDGPDSDYLARVTAEVTEPLRIIKKRLGKTARHFAYPFGDTSEEVISVLKAEGYETAATVQRGGNAAFMHPLLLRRNMVYGDDDLADFKKKLRVFIRMDLKR